MRWHTYPTQPPHEVVFGMEGRCWIYSLGLGGVSKAATRVLLKRASFLRCLQ